MIEEIQDEALAKADLAEHERLKVLRQPYEDMFKEVDERFPDYAGGFDQLSPGRLRGSNNTDTTHITALERFAAMGVAVTTPQEKQYIRIRFDDELMKIRNVALWCERASARAYNLRHANRTGFATAANEDWDQLGRYGTSLIYTDGRPGRGMAYRALHLAECYIDVDYSGLVDTVHRRKRKRARELAAEFGRAELTPKMRDALAANKPDTEFEIAHIVAPNTFWDADKWDFRRFPIGSRFLALEEKLYIGRGGFYSSPIAASRHSTSPNEIYGRSPAIKQMSAIHGVNAMRRSVLRAAHKAVDPALIFNNDAGATRLVTRAGGLNPGMVDDRGNPMVHRMPGGEAGLPFAENETEQERMVIRTAFLEEFYKILTDPNSRMTTTEVLEVMGKQGVLVRPFASRYATEKQDPMAQRELDLWIRNKQLEPFPPEVLEAGAWPFVEYENMLAAMARAESAGKTLRFMEAITPIASVNPAVLDRVDTDAMVTGLAEEIGVKPSYIRPEEQVEAIRQARAENEQASIDAESFAKTAGGALDLAKARAVEAA